MNHLSYLFAAYSFIFVTIFLYLLFIGNRQSRLDADLKELEAELQRLADQRSASSSNPTGRS